MQSYRFGKHPPKRDYRTLRFQDYLSPALSPPEPAHNVLAAVYANLRIADPAKLFPLDGNDTLGDCTIAAVAHASTAYHALIGRKTIMSRADMVKVYLHLTGGIDSGLNELDVLNYWRKHPMSGGSQCGGELRGASCRSRRPRRRGGGPEEPPLFEARADTARASSAATVGPFLVWPTLPRRDPGRERTAASRRRLGDPSLRSG